MEVHAAMERTFTTKYHLMGLKFKEFYDMSTPQDIILCENARAFDFVGR